MSPLKPKTVDEYIEAAPEHAREKLNEIRSLLKSVAPDASEELKWGQPVLIEKRIYIVQGQDLHCGSRLHKRILAT